MPIREGLSGPYVASAFLCEKVLTERDGVLSFIRVIDRFTVPVLSPGSQLPPGVMPPSPSVQFTLVIQIKAGDLTTGSYTMRVVLNKPNGEEIQSQEFSIFFNGGDENGVAVISPMALSEPDEGLHWFDVYFEAACLTRIPLRVLRQNIQLMPGLAHGG